MLCGRRLLVVEGETDERERSPHTNCARRRHVPLALSQERHRFLDSLCEATAQLRSPQRTRLTQLLKLPTIACSYVGLPILFRMR